MTHNPPHRTGLFCLMDVRCLDAAGWSAFDDLDGRLDAPEALPAGASGFTGPYADTAWVPREWERHALLAACLRAHITAQP